jgi:hypothetical protein
MLFVSSWMTLFLNSDVLLAQSTSVLFLGHRKRFDAIGVKSDVFEKAILGFLLLVDGFSTDEMISDTLCLVEKALLAVRLAPSSEKHVDLI